MKRFCLPLLFLLLLAGYDATAQDSTVTLKRRAFEARIKQTDGSWARGFLRLVTDSTVVLSPKKISYGSAAVPNETVVPVQQIKRVWFRRTGGVGRGAAIGAGVGLATGLAAGLAITGGKSNEPGGFEIISNDVAVGIVTVLGTVTGALAGLVMGAVSSKDIVVNGQAENLRVLREYIENRLRPAVQ